MQQEIIKNQIWEENLLEEIKYTYYEKGQIIKRYDILNKLKLPPQLNVLIKYPQLARENEIEGKVHVELTYDEDCIPTQFKALNTLGFGIDEEEARKMNLMIELSQR